MSFKRQAAEANTAKRKFAQIATPAPAPPASVVNSRRKNVQVQPSSFRALDGLLVVRAGLFLHAPLRILESPL